MTTETKTCACGATLKVRKVRKVRKVTWLGLWCGHVDVVETTGDVHRCKGRDDA